jgi:ribosomal protein L32
MAVPKKKISYSKTRIRLLSKDFKSHNYIRCKKCKNFKKIHSWCSRCFVNNKSVLNKVPDPLTTNINIF